MVNNKTGAALRRGIELHTDKVTEGLPNGTIPDGAWVKVVAEAESLKQVTLMNTHTHTQAES